MKIKTLKGEHECTPENSVFVTHKNDLLDGLYVDGENDYLFVSKHLTYYPEIAAEAAAEGVETVFFINFSDDTFPTQFVINGLARTIIAGAEALLDT